VIDPNPALIESWQLHLHEKSPSTRKLYATALSLFTRWLAGAGRETDLLAVQRKDLDAWFSALAADGLAQATRRSRWIALRSFYGWAAEEDEIADSPMAKVRVARADEPPPRVLGTDEIKGLLKVCEGRNFIDRRDMALLRCFLATGARRAEVTNLLLDDIDLVSRVLVITRGKGGRRRVVRIDAPTAAAIDRYKRARGRHKNASSPRLWLGTKGPLSESGVVAALLRRAELAGVEGFHLHLLRHWFAHSWQARGGNESSLQVLGGWQDRTIMARYGAALQVDRALDHYDEINPLEGM